jgi:hypothetical protein
MIPEMYFSETKGLLRVVDGELRGPHGVLDELPEDAFRLVAVHRDPCDYCECGREFHQDGVGSCSECGDCGEYGYPEDASYLRRLATGWGVDS